MSQARRPHSEEIRAEIRPWYREPWPWVLIAIPLLTVIASAITLWLAVSRPDYLVIGPEDYQDLKSELRAAPEAKPGVAADRYDGDQ